MKDDIELKDNGDIDIDTLDVQSQEDYPQMETFYPLDTKNLEKVKLNKDNFQKGINEYSYYAGAMMACMNVGLSSDVSLQLVLNNETIKHNIESLKLANKNNIEVAKVNTAKVESQQL